MSRSLIGYRIARLRGMAGMTQQELAAKIGKQHSYISLIENGHRPVGNRNLLYAIAEALGVSPERVTGQPYAPTTPHDLVQFVVLPQIRRALEEPDDGVVEPRPLAELDLAADRAMAARMNCDMEAIGQHLPALLAETRLLWFDQGNRDAGILFVKATVTGALAFKAGGHIDIGIRLAELASTVSSSVGDPVCIAAARFATAQCALATGSRPRSARIATAGIDELDRLSRTRLPGAMMNDVLAWMGVLHLHAALSEASLPNGDPTGHASAAEVLSRHVTGDPWRMEFSPANVGTWRVGIALENETPELAPDLARRVNPNDLHTPQRRSRLWLDLGRGLYQVGDTDGAIRALLDADQAAPGDLRSRATAVEIVAHMVRQAGRRNGSQALRDLAVKVGVDPVAPEPI